jgi:acid phosphatase
MKPLLIFLFLILAVTVAALSTESEQVDHLLLPSSDLLITRPINCHSWHFGVETNNIRDWAVVPADCVQYVTNYMTEDGQYESDCDAVVDQAIDYIDGLEISDKDIWVFDIDETALSNLDYYKRDDVRFGSKKLVRQELNKWIISGNATSLMPVQRLYNHLVAKKVKTVFLTGVREEFRKAREKNLQDQGYAPDHLILKGAEDKDLHGSDFKSAKRRELETSYGYNIIGNIGDQWSDIIGTNVGKRTFKLPNPMYYV